MNLIYLLDNEEVLEICHRYDEEEVTYADLARSYGVDQSVIASIVSTYRLHTGRV